MANSIGGNLEISAIMDASGIQTGADRGQQSMQDLSASAERMAANLAGVGGETVALTSSLSNAAKMVELLSAKMLAGSAASATARRASGANVQQELGLGPSRNPADSHAMAQLRMEIEERNRFNSVRIRQAAELNSELASYARQEAAEEERIRAETMANLRRDIEARSAMERQRVTEQAGYARQEAAEEERIRAETMANLRRDIEARSAMERQRVTEQAGYARQEAAEEERIRAETMANLRRDIEQRAAADQRDRDDRLNFRMNAAQNSDTRNPLQSMQDSIQRMRAELNPMVGMQARLAREAMEFRQQMDLAVISGKTTYQNAKVLTIEFREQQRLLLAQAQHQEQGFLGMRRMGFAAQQFGYAIEDAASVYGTMGLAGAFRAAGNNLTAMAAQAGPVVGVIASLASAAIALGINFYNAKQRAAELKQEVDEINELRTKLISINEQTIETQIRLNEFARLDKQSQRQDLASGQQKLAELRVRVEAEIAAENQLEQAKRQNDELARMRAESEQERSLQWYSLFGLKTRENALEAQQNTAKFWQAHKETWSSVPDWFKSDDRLKAEEEVFNAESRRTIELNRQEAAIKKANSAEQQRLNLIGQQLEKYRQIDHSGKSFDTSTFNVNDPRSMRQRSSAFAFDTGGEFTKANSEQSLVQVKESLIRLQTELLQRYQDASKSVHEREMGLRAIEGIEKEINNVEAQRKALQEAGQAAQKATEDAIVGRFEALNEELRIENEIFRIRKKTAEETELAQRAGKMTLEEADKLKVDLNRVIELEQERRDNLKEIEKLQKRESQLQSNVRQDLSPATALGGLQRGSDETRAFLENERLRGMARNDAEPQIVELRKVRDEIKRLREANEKAATARPKTAAIF